MPNSLKILLSHIQCILTLELSLLANFEAFINISMHSGGSQMLASAWAQLKDWLQHLPTALEQLP